MQPLPPPQTLALLPLATDLRALEHVHDGGGEALARREVPDLQHAHLQVDVEVLLDLDLGGWNVVGWGGWGG